MKDQSRVQTLHPEPGKKNKAVERWKYDRMRAAILEVLTAAGPEGVRAMPSAKEPGSSLEELVTPKLGADWDGRVSWYLITVRLDLEARGEVERVPGARPLRVRLSAG